MQSTTVEPREARELVHTIIEAGPGEISTWVYSSAVAAPIIFGTRAEKHAQPLKSPHAPRGDELADPAATKTARTQRKETS